MPRYSRPIAGKLPDLNFALILIMLLVLWIAGGASRADVLGQTIVRATAWLVAIVGLLFAPRPSLKPVAPALLLLFLAAVGLVGLHLVPLPPAFWAGLPGRQILAQSANVIGEPQPWRPLSFSPEATMNALSSLIVPAVTLILVAPLTYERQWKVSSLLLVAICASCFLGLMQFAGSHFDNPLINDVSGSVSGTFANRNHFALLLACGCVLAPAWAFQSSRSPKWRVVAAIGLLIVFALMILATGSRMGVILGVMGITLGIVLVWRRIKRQLQNYPRHIWIPVVVTIALMLVVAVGLSIALKRAISVDRAISLEATEDLRTAALPTVWGMVLAYWPVGSGFGAFDPVYRIHEPDGLLNIFYFNHAHNDWLEVVLDGGLPGAVLLAAALGWWAMASYKIWKAPFESKLILPRVGSSVLFLIALASLVDYPARTPFVMALAMIAAAWLSSFEESRK